jgi:hypothetical protein
MWLLGLEPTLLAPQELSDWSAQQGEALAQQMARRPYVPVRPAGWVGVATAA